MSTYVLYHLKSVIFSSTLAILHWRSLHTIFKSICTFYNLLCCNYKDWLSLIPNYSNVYLSMVRVCVGGGEVTVMHEIVFAGGGVIWSEVYFCYFTSNINEFFKMRGGSGSLNLTPFSKSLHTMLLAPIIKSKAGNRRREGA